MLSAANMASMAAANMAIQNLTTSVNNESNKRPKPRRNKNLSLLEERGMKWLRKKVNENQLSICEADKGGSILLVSPAYLSKKIEEKVMNPCLYEELIEDPRQLLYTGIVTKWIEGKSKRFVTEKEAKEIVGVTKNDNKSTASRFKPGRTYFSPSLKIHKLKPEEIVPNCDIPVC